MEHIDFVNLKEKIIEKENEILKLMDSLEKGEISEEQLTYNQIKDLNFIYKLKNLKQRNLNNKRKEMLRKEAKNEII